MSAAPNPETRVVTYREALNLAHRWALDGDPRVFLMGEDVGAYGGCFGVSRGLIEVYGPGRIRDTPQSESNFVGAGIGAALGGMRPIGAAGPLPSRFGTHDRQSCLSLRSPQPQASPYPRDDPPPARPPREPRRRSHRESSDEVAKAS